MLMLSMDKLDYDKPGMKWFCLWKSSIMTMYYYLFDPND